MVLGIVFCLVFVFSNLCFFIMTAPLYNQEGKTIGEITLPAPLFEKKWNPDLVHRVALAMLSNARMPVAHSKDRGEVRGGGKKPWKQKGTGRARHGSTRSPIWIGGGVTHGPRNERNYTLKVNKRERRAALLTALSQKARDNEVIFVDALSISKGKTRSAAAILRSLAQATAYKELVYKKGNRALIAIPAREESVVRAFRNIPVVQTETVQNLSVADLLAYKYLVIINPEASFKVMIEKRTSRNIR